MRNAARFFALLSSVAVKFKLARTTVISSTVIALLILLVAPPARAQLGFLYSDGNYTTITPPGDVGSFPIAINASGQVVGEMSGGSSGYLYSGGAYSTIAHPPGVTILPTAINGSGQVIGQSFGSTTAGFLYSGGSYTTLDPPGSVNNSVVAINPLGQIIGNYTACCIPGLSTLTTYGFMYSGGTYTTINPSPDGFRVNLNGINASGQIIGTYLQPGPAGDNGFGFLYSGGTYTTIAPPGSIGASPQAINSAGQVVGIAGYAGESVGYGFSLSGGTYTTIVPPGALGLGTNSLSENDLGQIVGLIGNCTNCQGTFGFLYDSGTYTPIDFPGSLGTFDLKINDLGQIIGDYIQANGHLSAFLLVDGMYTQLMPPWGAGVSVVADINDSGQIIGVNNINSPLPAGLPLFATGIGGLGLLSWRRKRKAQAVP